jgi:hypothetical protein
MVARWAHNPKVIGSSPVPATKQKGRFYDLFHFILIIVGLLSATGGHRFESTPWRTTKQKGRFYGLFSFILITVGL